MSWIFSGLKFVVGPWVRVCGVGSEWLSVFTTCRARRLFIKKRLLCVILYVALPHLFLWTKGSWESFCLQPCAPRFAPIDINERQASERQGEPLCWGVFARSELLLAFPSPHSPLYLVQLLLVSALWLLSFIFCRL